MERLYTANGKVGVSFSACCRSYISKQLGASYDELVGYWTAYGGWRAIYDSPALKFSALFALVCGPFWYSDPWQDTTISIIPNLLGFTLGAMAIVLAFPGGRAFKIISEGGRTDSFYISLASRFVHFINIQVIALLLALLQKAFPNKVLSFIGFTFLVYAIICAVMTGLSLFGVAQILNHPAIANDDESVE